MQFIELPTLHEDGSVDGTVRFAAEEVKTLLQFAVNFLGSVGHTAVVAVGEQKLSESNPSLND